MTEKTDSKLETFLRRVEDSIGTPWEHQGRVPGLGLDCIGLPMCAASGLGLNVQAPTIYSRQSHDGKLKRWVSASCDEVHHHDLRRGDLIIFWVDTQEEPTHIGVYAGKGRFIHARGNATGSGKVRNDLLSNHWTSRIDSYWRIRGLD